MLPLVSVAAAAEVLAMTDPNLRFIDRALARREPCLSSLSSEDLHNVLVSLDEEETDTGGAGAPPVRRPPVVAAAPAAPPGGGGPKKKPLMWWEMH